MERLTERPLGPDVGPLMIRAASRFAAFGLLAQASALLEPLGWEGQLEVPTGTSAVSYPDVLPRTHRHARGVHYTPEPVAATISRLALDDLETDVRVGDTSCGTGALLLAAAQVLHDRGRPVEQVVSSQLFGSDLDPIAVAIARVEIALWAAAKTGRLHVVPSDHLVVADTLAKRADALWLDQRDEFDVIIGNPPFGSQLRGDAVRDVGDPGGLAERLGVGALGYADTAALFLLHALGLVKPSGLVTMILPTSVAAASGSRAVREAVTERAYLRGVWLGGADVGFEAAVSVWAPLFCRGSVASGLPRVTRFAGASGETIDVVDAAGDPAMWAPLLRTDAPALLNAGAAACTWPGKGPTIGCQAWVTAGFRQHFYGLVPFVHDDPAGASSHPVLLTSGAIDPLRHRVDVPIRFAGSHYIRPVVDLGDASPSEAWLVDWVDAMRVPKLLVASQGRVVEVLVDTEGTMVPSTPVVVVVPDADHGVGLWQLAALLSSPQVAWHLHRMAAGTGMGGSGCRVSAGFVSSVELPSEIGAWNEAANEARLASEAAQRGEGDAWNSHLDRLGMTMAQAWKPARVGSDAEAGSDEVLDGLWHWWCGQRPGWRVARTLTS